MNRDEFVKEALKAKFEFLKIYALFLLGLVSAFVSMILSETYNENNAHKIIFIVTLVALIYVMAYFLVLTREIKSLLKQIKK